METCVFCAIVNGTIPAYRIWEDDSILVFLANRPINPGHLLIIPKSHEPSVFEIEDSLYQEIMITAKKMSVKLTQAFSPKKVGLIVAGWDVPHAHVHVVPMQNYHDITSQSTLEGSLKEATKEDLQQSQDKFREAGVIN